MPYPINQRAHQFNSIQSVPVSFGLWDTALKFLSPGPRNDVTDHLDTTKVTILLIPLFIKVLNPKILDFPFSMKNSLTRGVKCEKLSFTKS